MIDIKLALKKDNFNFSNKFKKIKLVETTAYLQYLKLIIKNN